MFVREFWDDILSGKKRRTCRMKPVVEVRVGEMLDLRGWLGKPYSKGVKQEMLGIAKITAVSEVTIRPGSVEVNGVAVDMQAFAEADGFTSTVAMWRWFAKSYGLNFSGIMIEWGALQ